MIGRRTDTAAWRRLDMIAGRCRSRAAIAVARYLAALERRHGKVTPSRAAIAAATGYSERTVSRAVGELEQFGAVTVWRDRPHCRRNGTYTRSRCNLYRLKWPPRQARPVRGHACPVNALQGAVVPAGGATSPAPTASRRTVSGVSDPDMPRLGGRVDDQGAFHPSICGCTDCGTGSADLDTPAAPVPPPWETQGISRDEWIRRCRTPRK